MKTEALHDWYNRRAREIWTDHFKKHDALPGMSLFPIQRPKFEDAPDLVMVGMNPSFVTRSRNPDAPHLGWRPFTDGLIEQFIVEEDAARTNYTVFYGRIDKFSEAAGAESPEDLDLLPLRHTNQAEVLVGHWNKQGEPNEFVQECLLHFKEALRRMDPKVVVVANAAASRLVVRLLSLERRARGRFYSSLDMPRTTFFLSGMLSGQRALDEFSMDRLAADVRAVLRPDEDPQAASL